MAKKTIRVGFDLDGVLLYNPARIARPIISVLKKYVLRRDTHRFYLPKNGPEKFIWNFLHKSSLWPSPGINELFKLIETKKIEAYVVSARYEFLKHDFNDWIKKIDKDKLFTEYYFNDKNEQPYLFKEKMIEKLKLDVFVEDNWDIVTHLNNKINKEKIKCRVCWIYNFFDRSIVYPYKYPTLQKVVAAIKSRL